MKKKTIGKIEKPTVEEFEKGKRKLYLVSLVYPGRDFEKESQKEYRKKIGQYWDEVKDRIQDLEAKLGRISRIYHEMVYREGKEGAEVLKELSQETYPLVQSSLETGSILEATENEESLRQNMDWARCLATGPKSGQVMARLTEFYVQSIKKRDEHIGNKINNSLKRDEVGILFAREGSNIDFASDIQIFRISPPVLDDIHRFLEDLYRPSPKDKKKD